jgi:hypothetical protein
MRKDKRLEKAANKAIKLLRKQKHRRGLHFMINSDMLETHQCFLEFPDGIIKIVEADSTRIDFKVVFEFNKQESRSLRRRLLLI